MTHPNIVLLKAVCHEIGDLLEKVVFVGGATTTLYLSDKKHVRHARSTEDVDMIINVKRTEYQVVEEKLRKIGFRNVKEVICRYQKGELVVDLMPIDSTVLGFSNRWYKVGFENAQTMQLDDLQIKMLRFPDFLATKLEAFIGRGNRDFFGSKDFEDIVTVLVGRPGFLGELLKEKGEQMDFIREQLKSLMQDPSFRQAVVGHVPQNSNDVEQLVKRVLLDLKELVGE
jgi:predicted nucleotidyltransferase